MLGVWWSRIRNYLYDKQYLTSKHASCAVVSIGNLTWGGTGKTALAYHVGAFFLSRKKKVAVISRGYGRESKGVHLVSDGRQILLGWREAGDEAYMLAKKLPASVVVVAEDRASGLELIEEFKPDLVLLDDAFQHRRIARDVDLVMIDASENLLHQRVLPFGKLREPLGSMRRANSIILTHSNRANSQTVDWISKNFSGRVFHANYIPLDPGKFKSKKVAAFCAIASPKHFFGTLQDYGASLVYQKQFPDHHVYDPDELTRMEIEAMNAGAETLVTTEKDAVKLDPSIFRIPFCVAGVELKIEEAEKFYDWIGEAVEKKV